MSTETHKTRPADNRVAPPSWLRRYGSQLGIIGVGIAMWLGFVLAAPAVFTNIDIYKAFAQTTPQFGIIALALTFVVITGEIDLSFPSIMALGTAAFCLLAQAGVPAARVRSLAEFVGEWSGGAMATAPVTQVRYPGGTVPDMGTGAKWDRRAPPTPARAPRLGEHTHEVTGPADPPRD